MMDGCVVRLRGSRRGLGAAGGRYPWSFSDIVTHQQPVSQRKTDAGDCFSLVGERDVSSGAAAAPKDRFQLAHGKLGQKPVASRLDLYAVSGGF